jgi:hypothetical protein
MAEPLIRKQSAPSNQVRQATPPLSPPALSSDGRTLWAVFSVYGEGAKSGVNSHDKFNLVKATLDLRPERC